MWQRPPTPYPTPKAPPQALLSPSILLLPTAICWALWRLHHGPRSSLGVGAKSKWERDRRERVGREGKVE